MEKNNLIKLVILFVLMTVTIQVNAQFIITVKTDNEGPSSDNQFTIPTFSGESYNYNVDWGDGTFNTNETGDATHTYASAGTYTISITGVFPRIYFNLAGDKDKLLSIDQWGINSWTSMESAFSGCINMDLIATDIPDLSVVSSTVQMFRSCSNFIGNCTLNDWDVSNITNMRSMFFFSPLFNQDISNWDVSSVTDMLFMFNSTAFNQDISSWDTSSVTTMKGMFNSVTVTVFDQNLGSWDIGNVIDFSGFGGNFSIDNMSITLSGWASQTVQPNINIEVRDYNCIGEDAVGILTSSPNNWIISGGGLATSEICDDIIILEANVYLQGAASNLITCDENLMCDDLRVAGIIPTTSPYADMINCTASVFDITGNDAIVDWVWIELRDENDSTSIITSQSALLQRDGDIVSIDGTSALEFTQSRGNYYISVNHRNHLGIMSQNPVALTTTATSVNFSNGSIVTFGNSAQTSFGMPPGILAMWAGNVSGDNIIQYSGANPDSTHILSVVLNDNGNFLNFPTYVVNGYGNEDVNLDGYIQYSGEKPDTTLILQNVLEHPENSLNFSTYEIIEQLPFNY